MVTTNNLFVGIGFFCEKSQLIRAASEKQLALLCISVKIGGHSEAAMTQVRRRDIKDDF